MRGNLQVRFLGEEVAVMSLPYPTAGVGYSQNTVANPARAAPEFQSGNPAPHPRLPLSSSLSWALRGTAGASLTANHPVP